MWLIDRVVPTTNLEPMSHVRPKQINVGYYGRGSVTHDFGIIIEVCLNDNVVGNAAILVNVTYTVFSANV